MSDRLDSSFIIIIVLFWVVVAFGWFGIPGRSSSIKVSHYEVNGTEYICPKDFKFDKEKLTCSVKAKIIK